MRSLVWHAAFDCTGVLTSATFALKEWVPLQFLPEGLTFAVHAAWYREEVVR